jgi:hypothetical protein
MDSVYALVAFATIIAADGSGAEHGLAGSLSNTWEVQNHVVRVSANISLMEYITREESLCRCLPYELEFFCLDLDSRICTIWPQSLIAKDQSLVDISWLPETRRAWKGDTAVEADNFLPGKPFKDSGQLLFWTSKTDFAVRAEKRINDLRLAFIVDHNLMTRLIKIIHGMLSNNRNRRPHCE